MPFPLTLVSEIKPTQSPLAGNNIDRQVPGPSGGPNAVTSAVPNEGDRIPTKFDLAVGYPILQLMASKKGCNDY